MSSAKSNAKRLREQDGGTLDLHRQSLRQHGLLNERDSVSAHTPPVGGLSMPIAPQGSGHDEAIKSEIRRQKEEAKAKEMEEMEKREKEKYSLWGWIRGK